MRIEIFAGGVKCTGPDAEIVLRLLFFHLELHVFFYKKKVCKKMRLKSSKS